MYHHDLLRGYGLLEADQDRLYLCTLTGDLITLKLATTADGNLRASDATLQRIHESKIFSLHVQDGGILTCGLNGELRLVREGGAIHNLILPACGDQRWVSCATLVRGALVVGDRCGGLHVYDLKAGEPGPDGPVGPVQSLRRAHGKRGVGDVRVSEDGSEIRTAGRDGTVKRFSMDESGMLEEIREAIQYAMSADMPGLIFGSFSGQK